jgi:ATP-dependent helicase HrpB
MSEPRKDFALPVEEVAGSFNAAIESHPVVVVSSPPGSGKTTMVPIFLRNLNPEKEIWVVQPRRIAAVMAAHQIARTIGQSVGEEVGYHIRFESVASQKTSIRCMTDGVLLRRLLDPQLGRKVAAICLDEFHERSLAMDIAAWWFRRAISPTKMSLPRLVILSATLERERLESYFPELAWIEAPGLSHPVTTHWGAEHETRSLEEQMVGAIRRAVEETAGSLLCFLPTVRSIEECIRISAPFLKGKSLELLPLHGGLSVGEQERAVRRGDVRRIIFATNIAESSLTVEGVDCVIDSGLARMQCPDSSGSSRLSVERISRASCIQRAGRAGREGPGVVHRLYPALDFSLRRAVELPEVRTKEATALLLWLALLGGDESDTPLIDEPSPEAKELAYKLLQLWGLIDSDDAITERGRSVAMMPIEPRVGAFISFALESGADETALWVAAVLGSDDGNIKRNSTFASQKSSQSKTSQIKTDRRESSNHRDEAQECDLLGAVENAQQARQPDLLRLVAQLQKICVTHQSYPIHQAQKKPSSDTIVRALVQAFPDRVAVRRQETDEYLFATGERAVLSRYSRAKNSRLIVVTDLQSGGTKLGSPGITITRATPIEEEMLFDLYPNILTSRTGYEWNEDGARVEKISESCFWSAPIETVRHPAAAGDEAGGLLLGAELRRRGLRWIINDEKLRSLLGRLAIATAPAGLFSAISASETDLIEWIATFPHRAVSHRQLTSWIENGGFFTVLGEHLGYQWREKLNEWCPETIPLPGRAHTTIHYEPGQAPVVMSRIQDFFGAGELPRIAGGTHPLRIHLLAPNGRTVQVTENLKTFWSLHYPTLRKQLQSRYPRHRWPDDPTQPCPPPQRGSSASR